MFALAISWFSSVQSLSCVWFFATPCTVARQASLSFTNSQSLLKLMSMFDYFQFTLIHGPNVPSSYTVLFFTALDLQVRIYSCKHRPLLHSTPVLMNKTSLILLQNAYFFSVIRHSTAYKNDSIQIEIFPFIFAVKMPTGSHSLWHLESKGTHPNWLWHVSTEEQEDQCSAVEH